MSLTNNALLDAALSYAADGLHVFPVHYPIKNKNGLFCSCHLSNECADIGKHPYYDQTLIPNGVLNASTDLTLIKTWWGKWPNANIGIATGEKSNLFVCDADSPIIVNDAIARGLPHTRGVRTGNGQHAYFKHPGFKVPNKVKVDGFDFRGDGGYVIAPPSKHANGKYYEWLTPADTPLAECPDWITALIVSSPYYAPSVAVKIAEFDTSYGLGALKKATASIEAAPNGDRNPTFYRNTASMYNLVAGGELLDQTVEYAVIEAAHTVGLLNGETRKTFESAKRNGLANPRCAPQPQAQTPNAKPNVDLLAFTNTDTGNAQRIVALYGTDIRYVGQWDTWVFWNGRYWQKDTIGYVARLAQTMIGLFLNAAVNIDDIDKRKTVVKYTFTCLSRKSIDNMLARAKDQLGMRVDASVFDNDPWLLNCDNGTLNLKTGKLQPHMQTDLITRILSTAFDPCAQAPTWLNFLDTVFGANPELINYIQRAIGYSITGDVREDCLHFAYGDGGNGKSTFFKALENLLGEYAHKSPSSMLMAQKFEGIPVDVASLQGKRFVIASEINKNARWNEAKIKDLTGGDKLTARYMRANPFSFEPTHKLWIYGNNKPIISGSDDGIKRRMRLIPFGVKIPETIRNEDFDALLIPELSGILNWVVGGCLEWQLRGLKPVDTVSHATANYIDEMDWLQTFIDDYCIVDARERCMFKYLYETYVNRCKALGEYINSKHEFQERLMRKNFVFKSGHANQLYIFGIRQLTQVELIAQAETAKLEFETIEM